MRSSSEIASTASGSTRLQIGSAEGVETVEQEQYLRDQGCDTFQGYLFSRPIEADAMALLLGQKRSI